MIPFFDIQITKEIEEAVIFALNNEKLVMGESVFKFEEEFAKYIGTKHAVSVNSGNAALQLSLLSLGINKNSKVVTSTNSFVASANCILMCNAQPVLSDIYENDGGMDITSVKNDFNAIIPVHIYGNPCDLDSINSVSEEKKIPIIEDAAQAHGASFRGKKVGSIGTIGCFSFYTTKNMTVGGDGGMITTNDEDVYTIVSSLRDNGRTDSRTEHDKLGYTMRLNNINAAIGRVQLKHLDEKNNRKRKIVELYKKYLLDDCILPENIHGKSVYHQIVIKHKNRNDIIENLKGKKIGTAIHYSVPIHKQPLYSSYNFKLPKSEKFSEQIVSIPSFPSLNDDQVKIISENINEVLS